MAGKYCSKCTTKCQPSAIRQLNTDLVGLLQYEIDVVLSNAYSTNLIGKQVKNTSKTDTEKATLLLNVITERTKTDPGTFDNFLELLRSSSSLEHLAKCLEKKVREFHQCDVNGEQQTPSRGDSGSSQAADVSNDPSWTSVSTDEEESDGPDQQPNGNDQQYQTRRKRPKKSAPSSSKAATCRGAGGKSKLDADDTEYESGVATASEQVPGDAMSDDESTVKLHEAETFDGDGIPQAPMFPVNTPQSQSDGESLTVGDSVIPFAVQEQSADQTDPLIGECDQQPVSQSTHAQVSEQMLDGTSTLVHGTGHADDSEDDWANRARYYVAIGASRETEKDKKIEELNQEKAKLEKELQEKEKKHAETIERETKEHQKQVDKLKVQLTEKENLLNTLQERRNTEIEVIERKFYQEKAQQEETLKEAKSEIENLKKQNSELEHSIAEKAKAVQTLSDEVEVQTQELEKLRETTRVKIVELEENLRAKHKEIEEFEAKKASEIGAIEEKFEEQISKLENELKSEKEAAKVREQLLESQSKVKFLEEEKKYIAEANELKLRIKALETMLAEEKVNSANKESDHLKAQLALQKVQSEATLKKIVKEKDKQIQEKDKQLTDCMKEIRRLSLSSTSSSEASLNIPKPSNTSDDNSQLQIINEVVKFQFQESPEEFT